MHKLAIILPVYNEEKNITKVINSIPSFFNNIDQVFIVVINDGSTDQTLQEIQSLNIFIINHKKNLGLGKTFKDGINKAIELDADIIVNIDGDGQFDPTDIQKLIDPIINKEADFVTASRFLNKQSIPNMSKIKYYGNHLMTSLINHLLGSSYTDVSCGFRAYNKEAICRLNLFGKFTYTQETFIDLHHKGLSLSEVPIIVKYFSDRESRIANNLFKYVWKTFKIIFRSTVNYKPLRFFGFLGIIFFIFGSILDLGLIIYYLKTKTFSPYKIVGFTGAFFNILGIIVFFLGLIADMLYRIRINQEEILYKLKINQK